MGVNCEYNNNKFRIRFLAVGLYACDGDRWHHLASNNNYETNKETF